MQGNSKAVANCEKPKCAACEFGTSHLQSNKVNPIKNNHMKDKELRKYHLMPGHIVSAYHYILRATYIFYHKNGKSDPYDMFSGGCVFICHVISYVRTKHRVDINSTETVKAKLTFEREVQSQGVVIKGYNTYNGLFNESEFIEDLLKK